MIDITKLQKLAAAVPPLVKAIPQRLEELTSARDAIMKAASPATAAVVRKIATSGKATPFAFQAGIFGAGFAAGAITTAFLTPMTGEEMRELVKLQARGLWSKWRGEEVAEVVEDGLGDDISEEAAESVNTHVAAVGERIAAARRPLSELTKDELYERAREADIPGRSEMDKQQLIEALTDRLN